MNQTIHIEEDTELDGGIEAQGFPVFQSVRLAQSPRCREIGTDITILRYLSWYWI